MKYDSDLKKKTNYMYNLVLAIVKNSFVQKNKQNEKKKSRKISGKTREQEAKKCIQFESNDKTDF